MKKYEAMFIIKPDLSEDDRKNLFNQISDAIVKNGGTVTNAAVWSERKKLFFPIKKFLEGVYYLVDFSSGTEAIVKLKHVYKLNENILRVLITKTE